MGAEGVGAEGDDVGEAGEDGCRAKLELAFHAVHVGHGGVFVLSVFGGVLFDATFEGGFALVAHTEGFEGIDVTIEAPAIGFVEAFTDALGIFLEEVHEVSIDGGVFLEVGFAHDG